MVLIGKIGKNQPGQKRFLERGRRLYLVFVEFPARTLRVLSRVMKNQFTYGSIAGTIDHELRKWRLG